MGVYLYCVLPGDVAPPAGLRGLAETAVRLQTNGPLACWVSSLDTPPEASVAALQRHNDVVQTALALGVTPLPVRFGQWLENDAALEGALRAREDAYEQALRAVEHAVEYGVRVLDPSLESVAPAPATAAVSGTAYMRQLAGRAAEERELESRGREIAVKLRAVLGSLVRQERIEALPSRHGLVSIAHLVERDCDAEYHTAIELVRRAHPALRFLITGPWPPYSFTP